MAGRILVSTLNDDIGVLAVRNGMTGISKAWVNFNGVGTVAIRSSFNVSSITDNGTGDYTINFATALPNANYSWAIGSYNDQAVGSGVNFATVATSATLPSTTVLRVRSGAPANGILYDCSYMCVSVFSS